MYLVWRQSTGEYASTGNRVYAARLFWPGILVWVVFMYGFDT